MTVVFKSRRFSVESVQYTLPDGSISENHYVLAPNGAAVIALDRDNRILITHEWRPKTNSYIWRIPAGGAEDGETLAECARREMREEVGYDCEELIFFCEITSNSSWYKQTKGFFIARNLYPAPLETGDELKKPETHFMDASEVLKLLNDGKITDDVAAVLYRFLHVNQLI